MTGQAAAAPVLALLTEFLNPLLGWLGMFLIIAGFSIVSAFMNLRFDIRNIYFNVIKKGQQIFSTARFLKKFWKTHYSMVPLTKTVIESLKSATLTGRLDNRPFRAVNGSSDDSITEQKNGRISGCPVNRPPVNGTLLYLKIRNFSVIAMTVKCSLKYAKKIRFLFHFQI